MHFYKRNLSKSIYKLNNFFLKIVLVLITIYIQGSISNKLYSNSLLAANNKPSLDYLNKKDSREYIIGIGDTLRIEILKDNPNFSKSTKVDITGKIEIPEFDRVYVAGLSLSELTSILNEKYSKIIKDPDINIEVIGYRPINVYLDGEIQNPGVQKFYLLNDENRRLEQFPTLFEVIQEAGGITNYADLTKVEIIRDDTISNGGGKIKTEINFLDFFLKGDNTLNLRIFDGDFIKIKKTNLPITGQISKALQSNINPKTIKIIINGQVEVQGTLTINKNSSLNDAILYAGGFKVGKGKIKILSFKSDGNYVKKIVNYKKNSRKGSESNPFLSNGDVVLVGRNAFSKANNYINEVSLPFVNIYTILRVFDLTN
tara:strand:- start:31168 stop:32283 length:1116 start_codon:yes stop_codon:yes gene_type:complete